MNKMNDSHPAADRLAIVGTGLTPIRRNTGWDDHTLAYEAVLEAIEDGGLSPSDVDGLATYPGPPEADTAWMADALGIAGLRYGVDVTGFAAAAGAAIAAACNAVASGTCEVAVAWRCYVGTASAVRPTSLSAPAGPAGAGAVPVRLTGARQSVASAPYGFSAGSQFMAMFAHHHFKKYGTSSEHLAKISIQTREHATRNPNAIARSPLTYDEYMASPFVSTPLRLLDCDYPVDAAGAVVITTIERARELRHPPAVIRAWSSANGPRPDWTQWADLDETAAAFASRDMWSHSGNLTSRDIDLLQLYDGFTIDVIYWLEALSICPPGGGGRYVDDNGLGLDAAIPINTAGGNLSQGRLHGIGHAVEGARQLHRVCGPRQTECDVVGVGIGTGSVGFAMLLHSDQ